MKGLGQGMKEFKKATSKEDNKEANFSDTEEEKK